MNRLLILFLIISFIITSCSINQNSKFEHKEWHTSPNRSPLSSTLYPYLDWEDAIELKVGLTKEDASFSFQSYHHPVNAIVYTKSPENEKYEIALRFIL